MSRDSLSQKQTKSLRAKVLELQLSVIRLQAFRFDSFIPPTVVHTPGDWEAGGHKLLNETKTKMSYILKTVRPFDLQNWVRVNAVGSLKATPSESWRAYLAANGGTGASIASLERSFLAAAGYSGGSLAEAWAKYSAAQTGNKPTEKIRNLYR